MKFHFPTIVFLNLQSSRMEGPRLWMMTAQPDLLRQGTVLCTEHMLIHLTFKQTYVLGTIIIILMYR